ncbi:hypothetical protein C8R43DRAFT_946027 [Mycena crocata]|nr:hypothetical protein C8R43DRAFT_946027 [Mycena crocata]
MPFQQLSSPKSQHLADQLSQPARDKICWLKIQVGNWSATGNKWFSLEENRLVVYLNTTINNTLVISSDYFGDFQRSTFLLDPKTSYPTGRMSCNRGLLVACRRFTIFDVADKHGIRLGLKSFNFGAWNILSSSQMRASGCSAAMTFTSQSPGPYCEEFGQTIQGLVRFKQTLVYRRMILSREYKSYPFKMTTSIPKWGLDKLWNKGVGPQKGYNLASPGQADD